MSVSWCGIFNAWGAHASGVLAIASRRSRTLIVTPQTNYSSKKFVSAECGNQHGATVRSPDAETPHSPFFLHDEHQRADESSGQEKPDALQRPHIIGH